MLKGLLKLSEDGLLQEEGREGGSQPRPGSEEPCISPGRGEERREAEGLSPPHQAEAHSWPSFLPPGPQCPLPFNASDVASGVILCERASGPEGAAVQLCQLLCRQGFQSAFPAGPLVCSPERRRWLSQPPHPRACQREWPPISHTCVAFPRVPGGLQGRREGLVEHF